MPLCNPSPVRQKGANEFTSNLGYEARSCLKRGKDQKLK